VVWYVDGVETARRRTPSDMNQPLYLVMNLAVGASWAAIGQPDATTTFPLTFDIAYVDVYRLGTGPIPSAAAGSAAGAPTKAGG